QHLDCHMVNLRISGRFIAGFCTLCAILAAAVGYGVYGGSDAAGTGDRMISPRTPVGPRSTPLVGQLHFTLAPVRGYLLTGDPQGKADRAAMWKELEATAADFGRRMERFTTLDDKRQWLEAKALLGEFRAEQDRAEAIAFTPDAYPATKILLTEAA